MDIVLTYIHDVDPEEAAAAAHTASMVGDVVGKRIPRRA